MNIVVYTFPFRGHSMQAIAIAEYLSIKGHHVTIDANSSYFQYVSSNIKKNECLYPFLCLPEDGKKDRLLNWAEGVFVTTKEYALNFREKVDLIIFDSMAYWGKYIAEKQKVPAISLMTIQPFTKEQFYDCVYKSLLRNYILESDELEYFLRKIHIYQVVAKNKFDLMDDFSFDDFLCARGNLNIVLLPKSMCKYFKDLGDSYQAFSPIIDINSAPLNNGSIYIASGSMICDIDLLITCIDVLLPYNKPIYVSSGIFTAQLENKYKNVANVCFYEFAPQKELLTQASVFITHGGSNSVCEAILTRTPMIVIPLVNDEFLNAEMISKNGIGLEIERDLQIIEDQLGSFYEEILNNNTYIERIDKIAQEIDQNKVWKVLDKFIEDNMDGYL